MLKHRLGLGVSFALLLTCAAGASAAQSALPAPEVKPDTQCGGQYECVEDRPMTPDEAQASRNHPQHEQAIVRSSPKDPPEVATTRPATTR